MAAPAEMKTSDFSGIFVMDKTLANDTDEVLSLQNIGWIMRTAISMATVTLHVRHSSNDEGVEEIAIGHTITGGIKTSPENRILDWTMRPHQDALFGNVEGKSRRVKLEEIDEEFLKTGWSVEDTEAGFVETYTVSTENSWIARQIWGFKEIDGDKRYVRHLHFTSTKEGAEKVITKQLVYSYFGALPNA